VIHAVHSNEMKDMGGLRKKMPVTTFTFVVGALSLSGIPGFAGFFSKDLILHHLQGRFAWVPWAMLLAAAFLTAFYMGRVLVRTFWGAPSEKAAHAHEGGLTMTGPLVVLAVPSLAAGFGGAWLARSVNAEYEVHLLSLTPVLASLLALSGLVAAVLVYGRGVRLPGVALLEKADAFGAVDRFWAFGYSAVLMGFARLFGWIDRYLVDGLINFIGWGTLETGDKVRGLQTGKVRDYALALAVGVLLLVLWGGWR